MMREGNNFLKRCLSLVLVAVLLLSNLNGLTMLVDAADEHKHVDTTVAEIVADNYDLTDAEKALLNSGYLASGTFTYEIPDANNGDGIVEVDTENAKITAKTYEGWVPTEAVIVYGDNELTVALNNKGEGTYDAAKVGNAFSVKVTYKLTTTVSADVQNALLKAPAALKQGVANLDAVVSQAGNLFVLEQALPSLNDLAVNGISMTIGGQTVVATFDDPDAQAAIIALHDQMTANGGALTLSNMISALDATQLKTGYLVNNGAAMHDEVVSTAAYVAAIADWVNNFGFSQYLDETTRNQFNRLKGVVSNMNTALTDVAAADWSGAEVALAENVDYAKLDTLVAALGEASEVTVKEELLVATTTVQHNLAMWNVTVNVVLNTVNSANEIKQFGDIKTVTLTLAEGATTAEILTAVANSGIEDEAIKAWGAAYVKGKYVASTSELPETLTKDLVYTVTYNPVEYTVTIAGEANKYPYGYKLTLPKHADASKSYDYTDAKGKYYSQGSVVIVEGDMTFTREEGKAYTTGNLLNIIADNYGTDKIAAILKSGALNVDEVINYREPSKAELEELVKLDGNTLTVQNYDSSYAGLSWAPYSYVVDGTEYKFDGKNEVTISGDFTTVNVFYRLTLANHTADDVKAILDLVATLVDEAEGQKSVMDKLTGYKGQMGQLTKNMLNGLNGVIGGYSSENGGGLHADPTTNDELVAYFQKTIGEIVKTCVDTDGYLKLYNIIIAYQDVNNGGLGYYYQNDATVRNEIDVLSTYLNDMLDGGDRQAALVKLMTENGYADKVDVLETLGTKLAEIAVELKPVNAAINTADAAKLSALAKTLVMEGSVQYTEYDSPYISMGPVIRTASKYVTVEVKVTNTDGKSETFSVTILKDSALTQKQINELKAAVLAFVGDVDEYFYENNFNGGAELDALAGVALDSGNTYEYAWTAKSFTVKIDGEADQNVSVDNLTITLPGHPNAVNGMSYEYTIGNNTAKAGIYTFEKEDLKTLFVNGVLTITRTEKNDAIEKFETWIDRVNASMGYEALVAGTDANGVYVSLTANISAADVMNLVMALVKEGYGYIALNNEGLIYEIVNANGGTEMEVSVQTLVNAFLNDEKFGSDLLIEIGEAGKGTLLNASLQLGNSATEIQYNDLAFTVNVTSVPSQFATAAEALDAVKNYVSFYSDNGIMMVELNLPDAVYGAYLTALVGTGNADKADINAVNQQIAFEFLYDYFEAIINSDMDAETFANTIAMLGKDVDLTKYNNYYKFFCSFMQGNEENYGKVVVTSNEKDTTLDVSLVGRTVVDKLLNLLGKDVGSLSTYLPMIKEYKVGGTVETTVKATLENPNKTYNAMIVDIQANGLTNKYACTSNDKVLANKLAALAGYSAVILLDDVDGDLTIAGTTILDLNGKTVNGSITSTGTLYIVDSSMGTYTAGTVTGNVSGSVVILAGNYNADVSACLKDGYYQDGTTVRNELYYITENNGDVTFVIDTDVVTDGNVPSVKVMAVDIAIDMVLNYVTSAALTVEGNEIYNVNFDDLLGLLHSDSKVDDVVNKVLNSVYVETGVTNVVNMILEDLLDFGAIYDALAGDGVVATYELTTNPWHVSLDHITDGNYMTVSIVSNENISETFSVSLKLEGDNKSYIQNLVGALKDVAYAGATVQLYQPTYGDKLLHLVGDGEAEVIIDFVNDISEDYDKYEDYVTIIGVILAYGNPDVAEAIKAALEANDMVAMKEIVDNTTVEEIFTALKAMSRNVDFKAMAEKVGVTVRDSAAKLEAAYHLVLCAAGKALEELGIVGRDSKLGSLETSYGVYNLSKENIFRDAELNVRSYSALAEVTAKSLSLTVVLFVEEEHEHVWGKWEVLSPATCCDEGVMIRKCTCEGCDSIETKVIPVDPNAHEWGEWVVVKEAEKYVDGEEQRTCKLCGCVETRAIPKTGDYTIMIIGTLALFSLLGVAYVQFVLKRRMFK